jgi:citrate synthase
MLFEIGDLSKVDSYIEDAFAKKKKIMGFGHRVYKTQDPRSPILKETARKICEMTGNQKWFKMLERIEEIVTPAKKLPSNVDFYSSIMLYSIGIPPELFTPMFLMSRIAGYSAHFLEQISDNRLIRPRANYTGPMDLSYRPVEDR